ncbi:MAG: polysaccharide deacetylase family protein [Ferruginibacter sp.]
MRKRIFIALFGILGMMACKENNNKSVPETPGIDAASDKGATENSSKKIADAATIMAMPQVPVLCYHHIRNRNESYSVSPQNFAIQMKLLSDSGYHTVLPGDLYQYLAFGKRLPAKPVMLTFDDTDLEQYTIGYAEMKKHDFKGVFFIMTISIGRPRYMNRDMLKQLADEGNAVEGHTWDHHMVTKYTAADWDTQITQANAKTESITGKKVQYFAYPFGLWKDSSIAPLKERNVKMAFQLSTKRDSLQPIYTVRRMIVPSNWSADGMLKAMKSTFSK